MSRMQGLTLPANVTSFVARQREQAEKLRAAHGVEAQSWYRITNAADSDEAEILLYDEIGGWWGCTADEFIAELREVSAPNIRVRINSPGGSVFEGIAIANALRSHPSNVTVQVDSLAASIASVIAMAGDRVEMAPNSMLMIHEASGLCIGDAADMAEMGQLLDLISSNIADAYAARAGGTREQWREAMRAESWYLPDDAVEAGLADEALATPKAGEPVAEPEPDPMVEPDEPEMRRQFDLTAYGYQGPPKPEAPKPGPPPAAEAPPTLTITLADLLDEAAVERLRAAVTPPAEPVPEPVEPEPAADAEPAASEEPAPDTEEPGGEPEASVDGWADLTAHLIPDDADTWSALVSNVIEPDTSSSAATA